MPRGDGTGPVGAGPMTGRGMGYCAGFRAPGYVNPGRGFYRWGCKRGFRHMDYATGMPFWQRFAPPADLAYHEPASEKTWLENRADALENELRQIRERLNEIQEKE